MDAIFLARTALKLTQSFKHLKNQIIRLQSLLEKPDLTEDEWRAWLLSIPHITRNMSLIDFETLLDININPVYFDGCIETLINRKSRERDTKAIINDLLDHMEQVTRKLEPFVDSVKTLNLLLPIHDLEPYNQSYGGVDFCFARNAASPTVCSLIDKTKFIEQFFRSVEILSGLDVDKFKLGMASSKCIYMTFGIDPKTPPKTALCASIYASRIVDASLRYAMSVKEVRREPHAAPDRDLLNPTLPEPEYRNSVRLTEEITQLALELTDDNERHVSSEQFAALTETIRDVSTLLLQGGTVEPKPFVRGSDVPESIGTDILGEFLDLKADLYELMRSSRGSRYAPQGRPE